MKKKVLSLVYVLSLTIFLMSSIKNIQASIDPNDFPRLDNYYFYEGDWEDSAAQKATRGIVDAAIGIWSFDDVEMLEDSPYEWTMLNAPARTIYVDYFNCRDVYPETAGANVDYHGRKPGESNFPLNISAFRFALKILISRPKMDEWVSEVFDWPFVTTDTVVTPAQGIWYNPFVPVELYNTTRAMEVLNSIGFYNNSAHTGLPDGYWANTNPAIGPVGELRHIYVMAYLDIIPYVGIGMRMHASWDAFFGNASDGKPYFINECFSWTFMDWLYITHYDRTFDITFQGWILGENLDYVYDFFHPDRDQPWTGQWWMTPDHNTAGLDHQVANDMEYAVKYWRWPNGTYITTIEEMRGIVWGLQELLYYLEPVAVLFQSVYVDAYHPDLAGMVNSYGYASDNWWNYNWLMWKDPTKTSANIGLPFTIGTLNPGWAGGRADSAWGGS